MFALTGMPMFGFTIQAFLLLCTILAVAVWFATRGVADPAKTRITGPAGCAIGCALLVVVGLGAIATVAVIVTNLPNEWARHGPISRLELSYDDPVVVADEDRPIRSTKQGVHAEIELRPGRDAGPILAVLRREISSGLDLTVRTIERDGSARTVIEIHAPLDAEARRELRQALEDLRAEIPGLDIPSGLILEVRGPND